MCSMYILILYNIVQCCIVNLEMQWLQLCSSLHYFHEDRRRNPDKVISPSPRINSIGFLSFTEWTNKTTHFLAVKSIFPRCPESLLKQVCSIGMFHNDDQWPSTVSIETQHGNTSKRPSGTYPFLVKYRCYRTTNSMVFSAGKEGWQKVSWQDGVMNFRQSPWIEITCIDIWWIMVVGN